MPVEGGVPRPGRGPAGATNIASRVLSSNRLSDAYQEKCGATLTNDKWHVQQRYIQRDQRWVLSEAALTAREHTTFAPVPPLLPGLGQFASRYFVARSFRCSA